MKLGYEEKVIYQKKNIININRYISFQNWIHQKNN